MDEALREKSVEERIEERQEKRQGRKNNENCCLTRKSPNQKYKIPAIAKIK